jgi:hypothetical protein
VLTKRGYTIKLLAAEAPIKKLARQIEDDDSDLIFNVCESLERDLSKLPPELPRIAGTEAKWEHDFKEAREFVPEDVTSNESESVARQPRRIRDGRAKPEMSRGDVIERIVELAMAYPIRERSAI